jgi:sugar/nucleoside kinase (ribokinase family)
MIISTPIEPIDYLLIGHLTRDLTPTGATLGGTAAFSALTARALGLRVGVVTSFGTDLNPVELSGIPIAVSPSEYTTTFENVQTPEGRIQYCYHQADRLNLSHVPELWRSAPVVHLGPVAQEVEISLALAFPEALLGVTPQGWLRKWDGDGRVYRTEWPEATFVLQHADVTILSLEDVQGDEQIIEDMAASCRILVVTEGKEGSSVYWNGDIRHFRPPLEDEIDSVGAGDIFSAAFFFRYSATHNPWEAARFATQLAAASVTRVGLSGVPTPEEVQSSMMEIL